MRVESLTFLRFIAALIVVISHFGVKISLFENMSLSGQLMVTFFFVLSGFVMTISQITKKNISLKSYWLSRLTRIVPLYICAMAFILCYFFSKDLEISKTTIALNLLFLQSWFSTDISFAINYPSWSLSVEMVFYFIFPFILFYIKKVRLKADILMFIALLFWGITQLFIMVALLSEGDDFLAFVSEEMITYHPFAHLCSFILGVAGGVFFIEKRPHIKSRLLSTVASGGILLILIFSLINENVLRELPIALGSSLFAPLFLILILVVASSSHSAPSKLHSRLFVLLGESSYALYILQIPLKSLYNNTVGEFVHISPLFDFILLLIFMIVGAVLSFILFERPVNKLLRSCISKISHLYKRRLLHFKFR